MTEPERADDQSSDQDHIESLGVRLRTAREHKGLSIDSVAHQLNLSQHRVLDMENDDYRFSNAETYAKGYLRAYAKLLGLDPEALIHDFDRLQFTDTIEHHETKFISKRQVSSSDRWMRWITYSIGLLLIFLVAIWWRSQPNSPSDTASLVSDSSEHTPIKIEAREHPQAQGADAIDGFSQELAKEPSALSQEVVATPSGAEDKKSSDQTVDASAVPSDQKKDQATSETSDSSTPKKDQAADNSAAQKPVNKPATPQEATAKSATDQAVNKTVGTAQGAAKVTEKTPAKTPESDDSDDEEDDADDDQSDGKKQSRNDIQRKSKSIGVALKPVQQLREAQSLQHQLEKEFKQG